MKILHIGFYDSLGGAAKAMLRIHNALSKIEFVDSKILVVNKLLNNQDIYELSNLKFKFFFKITNQIKKIFLQSHRDYKSFNLINTQFILNFINNYECDFVNLHWIGGEMISINEILKINKKIIWTFHDMWPFLGINHYETKNTYLTNKLNKYLIYQKHKLSSKRINVIAPSNWIFQKFINNKTFDIGKSSIIPYPIDTNFWNTKIKNNYTEVFNFKENVDYILFTSNSGLKDKRKGFKDIMKITKYLSFKNSKKNLEFIVLGSKEIKRELVNNFYINFLPRIDNDDILKYFYINSSLTLLLSKQDNLPLVMQESMACGTPLITFDNGGMSDLITDNYNGFIIKNFDITLLSAKIYEYLNYSESFTATFKMNCIKTIQNKCSEDTIKQSIYNFYLSL